MGGGGLKCLEHSFSVQTVSSTSCENLCFQNCVLTACKQLIYIYINNNDDDDDNKQNGNTPRRNTQSIFRVGLQQFFFLSLQTLRSQAKQFKHKLRAGTTSGM